MEALLPRKLSGAVALPAGGVEFVNGSNGGKVKVHPFNVRRAAVALTQAADKLPEERRQQLEDMIRAHRGLSLQPGYGVHCRVLTLHFFAWLLDPLWHNEVSGCWPVLRCRSSSRLHPQALHRVPHALSLARKKTIVLLLLAGPAGERIVVTQTDITESLFAGLGPRQQRKLRERLNAQKQPQDQRQQPTARVGDGSHGSDPEQGCSDTVTQGCNSAHGLSTEIPQEGSEGQAPYKQRGRLLQLSCLQGLHCVHGMSFGAHFSPYRAEQWPDVAWAQPGGSCNEGWGGGGAA